MRFWLFYSQELPLIRQGTIFDHLITGHPKQYPHPPIPLYDFSKPTNKNQAWLSGITSWYLTNQHRVRTYHNPKPKHWRQPFEDPVWVLKKIPLCVWLSIINFIVWGFLAGTKLFPRLCSSEQRFQMLSLESAVVGVVGGGGPLALLLSLFPTSHIISSFSVSP